MCRLSVTNPSVLFVNVRIALLFITTLFVTPYLLAFDTHENPFIEALLNATEPVELPIEHSAFDLYLIAEESDWDAGVLVYRVNVSNLNPGMFMYLSKTVDIESLEQSKKLGVAEFRELYPNSSLEEFALELYRSKASEDDDYVHIYLPIFRFNVNQALVIGYLTIVASENDTAYAAIRMYTYDESGELLRSEDRRLANGIPLKFGFSSEDGAVNISSTVTEAGYIYQNRVSVYGKKLESEATFLVTSIGFASYE